MTPLALVAMRKAASLAFAVPGLEVDINFGGETIARVERRFDGSALGLSTTLLSPCAFRGAVGRALAHARQGGTALFLGLPADAEPTLRYMMPFTGPSIGAVRPLDMIVSKLGETVIHVFATTVAHDVVVATLRGDTLPSLGEFDDVPDDVFVSASLDPVAAVTLVYCEARLASLPIARPVIERVMEAAQVRFGVDEITTEIERVRS